MDFQLRIACGHVKVALWTECRNFVDFELKIVRIHAKTAKIDGSGSKLLPWTVQNSVQNRDIFENPRWGPYKNHKNVMKYRSTPGNCWKTVIFTFWTASITSTRQLVAEAKKSWFFMRKSFGSIKITKIQHLFSAIYLVLVAKIVFRIVIFRKILDRDPTKIT